MNGSPAKRLLNKIDIEETTVLIKQFGIDLEKLNLHSRMKKNGKAFLFAGKEIAETL